MPENKIIRTFRAAFLGRPWQILAMLFTILLGAAIILNVQMEGDAEWFWYARFFHQGVKLYADMHLALQPLFVLETNLRMILFGQKCIPFESVTLFHVLAMSLGMLLVLKESRWPDWQKALLLAACFPIVIQFNAYRFDDFHILADSMVVYTLAALLMLAHAETLKRELVLAAVLGILSGMATTTDLPEGAALVVSAVICVPFLARRRRWIASAWVLLAALTTMVVVVRLTGDSLHDYAANSIFRAATAKGGTGSVLRGAMYGLWSNFSNILQGRKQTLLWLAAILAAGAIVAAGAAIKRFWHGSEAKIVAAQLGIAALIFAASSQVRAKILHGTLSAVLSEFAQPLTQMLMLLVAARWLWSLRKRGATPWDAREMLILVPIGVLMASAASQANGTSNNFLTMVLVILLVPVIEPWRKVGSWANPSFISIVVLAGLSATAYKVLVPYSWFADASAPMFEHREWYQHPLYGAMYVSPDLPEFFQPVCSEVWPQGTPQPELLTLPYSYPNYFCGIPPWRHYVQTWFDTVAPATLARLIDELNTAPPQWIVYQRQLVAMRTHEEVYNHGQPIAQRALDDLIMQKITSGQWTLVDKRTYLQGDDGWYIIRTHP